MDENDLRDLISRGVARWRGSSPYAATARFARRKRGLGLRAMTVPAIAAAMLIGVAVIAGSQPAGLQRLLTAPAADTQPTVGTGEVPPSQGLEPTPTPQQEPTPAAKQEPTPAPKHEPTPAPKHEPSPTPCDCKSPTPTPSPQR